MFLPESEKSNAKIINSGFQIQKMPELTEQAYLIDQILLSRLQDLKVATSAMINQFKEQKGAILQRFDNWIMPIAQDVLDGFILDAQKLKNNLDNKLEHLDQVPNEEGDDEAKRLMQLYSKWNDRKGLVNKILELIVDKTKQLIDRDVQVVKDYRTQSLSSLQETEKFKNVEERLAHAIEEPLKQLMSLRDQAKGQTSLQQASDWVAKLQERREIYFDQLLMKIDHVMKDVVNVEETNDWTACIELEGEILFMEQELHDIRSNLIHAHSMDEKDKVFLLARLEGLLDHVGDFNGHRLPALLKTRIEVFKSGVVSAMAHLEG